VIKNNKKYQNRGGQQRYIGIGNEFSGLYCPVQDETIKPSSVSYPFSHTILPSSDLPSHSSSSSHSSSHSDSHLKQQQEKEEEEGDGERGLKNNNIALTSHDLFSWAYESSFHHLFKQQEEQDEKEEKEEMVVEDETKIIKEEEEQESDQKIEIDQEEIDLGPCLIINKDRLFVTNNQEDHQNENENEDENFIELINKGSTVLFYNLSRIENKLSNHHPIQLIAQNNKNNNLSSSENEENQQKQNNQKQQQDEEEEELKRQISLKKYKSSQPYFFPIFENLDQMKNDENDGIKDDQISFQYVTKNVLLPGQSIKIKFSKLDQKEGLKEENFNLSILPSCTKIISKTYFKNNQKQQSSQKEDEITKKDILECLEYKLGEIPFHIWSCDQNKNEKNDQSSSSTITKKKKNINFETKSHYVQIYHIQSQNQINKKIKNQF